MESISGTQHVRSRLQICSELLEGSQLRNRNDRDKGSLLTSITDTERTENCHLDVAPYQNNSSYCKISYSPSIMICICKYIEVSYNKAGE